MKRIMKQLLLVLVMSMVVFSCNSQESKKNKEVVEKENSSLVIAPQDYKNESEGQLIIDVRTPEEYAEGHIKGAININFMSDNFESVISKIEDKGTVFIYCRSGGRSGKSSVKFLEVGFKKVVDLEGGIKNWQENKFKVEK